MNSGPDASRVASWRAISATRSAWGPVGVKLSFVTGIHRQSLGLAMPGHVANAVWRSQACPLSAERCFSRDWQFSFVCKRCFLVSGHTVHRRKALSLQGHRFRRNVLLRSRSYLALLVGNRVWDDDSHGRCAFPSDACMGYMSKKKVLTVWPSVAFA